MSIEDLKILFGEHPELAAVRKALAHNDAHVLLSGLHASARALALAQLRKPILVIFDNAEAAQYIYSDLRSLESRGANEHSGTSQESSVFFFPHSQKRRAVDEAAQIQRTECLTALTRAEGLRVRGDGLQDPLIIVTYPEAIAEPVPAKEELTAISFQLSVGQEVQISAVSEQLSDLGFERVDFVFQPGQYAVRGSIVDVYSYSHDDPYRLDFFGDEIDSIRTFDIEDQLSKSRVENAEIVGLNSGKAALNSSEGAFNCAEGTFTQSMIVDYLTDDFIWVSNDWSVVKFKLEGLRVTGYGLPDDRKTIELNEKSTFATHSRVNFETTPQPVFHKQFDILTEDLKRHIEEGYKVYILAEQQKQLDRLEAIFDSINSGDAALNSSEGTLNSSKGAFNYAGGMFIGINATLHEGFVDKGLKICCYTDHQIFERFHRVMMSSENARRGKAIITLREINQLQVGDYVVHSDHGIAKFGGLVTTPVNGKPQEMIKLNYRDGANVFVSIHNLHRISKYKGREGSEPTIARLGSGQWERLKERTKDKVKDIARDLIRLYATRKQQKGFAYSPDGYMQHELEASFLYEDTPDQAKATAEVKHDLESPMPMDRLVCGDVGFGKTEVAMRAAFKVATDGKQVAVLVPTTVLT